MSNQACSSSNGCPATMVCLSGKCSACSSDMQCEIRNPNNRCTSSSSDAGRFCAHKTFGEDFGAIDILLLVITFLSTALSAPTGTGGGGIMVPVFMLLCGFSAQDAIPLSKVCCSVFSAPAPRHSLCPGHYFWTGSEQQLLEHAEKAPNCTLRDYPVVTNCDIQRRLTAP